jgi:predicted DNA-binding transcriptional regulator AlpA
VSPSTTTVQLLKQVQLMEKLGVGKWTIDNRIERYPKGHPNAFPVEYIGRFRRFELAAVRAWFEWEAAGFPAERNAA